MHKRKIYKNLTYYFNRLNQENKDYILSFMIRLFREQNKKKYQGDDIEKYNNIIYLYKD